MAARTIETIARPSHSVNPRTKAFGPIKTAVKTGFTDVYKVIIRSRQEKISRT